MRAVAFVSVALYNFRIILCTQKLHTFVLASSVRDFIISLLLILTYSVALGGVRSASRQNGGSAASTCGDMRALDGTGSLRFHW